MFNDMEYKFKDTKYEISTNDEKINNHKIISNSNYMSSSDGNILTSHLSIKTGSAFGLSYLADKYYFNELDMMHNLTYAAASAGGIAVGSMIGGTIPSILNDTTYYSGKSIAQRSFELIFGATAAYSAFYVSGKNYTPSDMSKRFVSLVIVDFLSEYVADYVYGEKLSYLT